MSYPANSMNPDSFDQSFGPNSHGINSSTWDIVNEERPMPMPVQGDLHNQYFQMIYPAMVMASDMMEDMRMRQVDMPEVSMQFSPSYASLGLPGGNATDMMHQLQSHFGTPLRDAGQVDPMLLAFDSAQHEIDPVMASHAEFQNSRIGVLERELDQQSVNSLLGVGYSSYEYHPEQWQPDPNMTPLEPGLEFEKWVEDHHAG